MFSEKTDAILIRQTDFSETSRVVTFFTREHGKLGMMAKGGRRRRNPFDDSLDLLAESSIVFLKKASGSLQLLTEASLKNRFRPEAATMQPLYAGYYIAELLDGLSEEADPNPELYDAAAVALRRLEKPGSKPLRILARFETQMLRQLGHFPSLDSCLKCGRKIASGQAVVHWVSQGGLLCDDCRSDAFRQDDIHADTLSLLRHLADTDEASLASVQVTERQVREVRQILDSAVAYLLERRPRMLRYLQQSGERGGGRQQRAVAASGTSGRSS